MPLDNTGADRSDAAAAFPEFNQDWDGQDPRVLAATREALRAIHYDAESGVNMDADSVYFARALDYSAARNLQVLRANSGADDLVPVSTDIPQGTETVSYTVFDAVGMAKVIGANVDDLPRADVRGKEMVAKVQPLGVSYGYTRKDLRNAARSGSALPQRKADAARAAMAQKERALKIKGDPLFGMFGLLNHPNMPAVVPAVGNWSAGATTAENIRDDFMALVAAVVLQSKGNFTPNRVGIPFQLRMAAIRKTQPGTGGKSAMALIQEAMPNVRIVDVNDLAGQGAGGTHVMVATVFDPLMGAYERVMPFTEYPPQPRNLELVVDCESETAGLILYQPLAFAKMEGL